MIRYRLGFIFLFWLVIFVKCEEEQINAEDRLINEEKAPDKLVLKKSEPYKRKDDAVSAQGAGRKLPTESSEKNDQVSAEGGFGEYHYLPPPQTADDRDCSPCNLVPWIPVAGHSKVNYITNYKEFSSPFSNIHSLESILPNNGFNGPTGLYLPPKTPYLPPKENYGPSQTIYGPSKPSYRPPKPAFGPPKPTYGSSKPTYLPPTSLYGPPLLNNNFGATSSSGEIFLTEYMLPPPISFKIPSLLYNPPKTIYNPPPKNLYGPPPKNLYGPPPKEQYGPPFKPKPTYGPPKPDYGPPQPNFVPPNSNYSPPKPDYGPPQPDFGPPKPNYGPPKPEYGPPKQEYGHPKPNYVSPKQEYGPPKQNYGPPINNIPPYITYGEPLPMYGPPKPQYQPPEYLAPPMQGATSTVLQPVSNSFSTNLPNLQDSVNQDFVPPTLVTSHLSEQQTPNTFFNLPNSQEPLNQGFSTHVSDFGDQSFSGLSNIPLEAGNIAPPTPSDSYGNPVTGENTDFNGAFDSLPAPSGDSDLPNDQILQHFPNINPFPSLPRYEITNFQRDQRDNVDNVQVQQSVRVADYVASIEHPINIIQSPLVELQVKEASAPVSYNRIAKTHHVQNKHSIPSANSIETIKLSEHPIVVDDINTAASNINSTVTSLNEIYNKNDNEKTFNSVSLSNKVQSREDLIKNFLVNHGLVGGSDAQLNKNQETEHYQNTTFKTTSLNYNDWIPKYQQPVISSSMVPPPINNKQSRVQHINTQKPKQIIIPYTKSSKNGNNVQSILESYTTLVPIYTPPMPTEQSDWSKYLGDIHSTKLTEVAGKPFAPTSTAVYNIKDLLSANTRHQQSPLNLPYDIISLQKNINDWTHQSFSTGKVLDKNSPPKQIPGHFFTTKIGEETTTETNDIFDNHSAESSRKETFSSNSDIRTNLIVAAESVDSKAVTVPSTTPKPGDERSLWKTAHVTVSPYTKEKIYVVTPQAYSFVTFSPAISWSMAPKVQNGTSNNITLDSHKFSIRVEPQSRESREKTEKGNKTNLKVVYSEWPHLINNLQTTTPKTTSPHPLFGLMGISAYTPPLNSTVETFVGHSRVNTVVTPSTKDFS